MAAVFLIALLVATACSADCLDLSCAPPVAAEASGHGHHAAMPPDEMPVQSHQAPEGGDCATHGHATVFVAQATKSLEKPQLLHAGSSGGTLTASQAATTLLPFPVFSTDVAPQLHSPPTASPEALPLRI